MTGGNMLVGHDEYDDDNDDDDDDDDDESNNLIKCSENPVEFVFRSVKVAHIVCLR